NYAPDGNVDQFEKISQTSFIELLYVRPIKAGTITYSLPILATTYENDAEEKSLGLSVSYAPFWINKRFAPSVSLGFFNRNEAAVEDKSTRYEASASIQSEWTERLSTFANFTYRNNSNNSPSLSYTEYEGSLNATW